MSETTSTLQDNRARLKQWLASGEIRLQPLTFPQRELWEAAPVSAGDAANNICAMIHVRGRLTPEGCEAALQMVVDRQEVFRLSFLPGKEQPVQMIRKSGKANVSFHELAASHSGPEAVEEVAEALFQQPFDLVQGPLYRPTIISRAPDDHVLALAIHHSIADGWTLGVFVQDLFAAYQQVAKGMKTGLPPVPLTYTDWGAAERAYWQPALLEERGAFWREKLACRARLWKRSGGFQTAGGTSFDSTFQSNEAPSRRLESRRSAGLLQRFISQIPPDLGKAVRAVARRNGATLFSALLTGFQITLSKWTGAENIVVGTPVANRGKQAVRETMGYCSGIVPLRGQVDHARSFSDSLKLVHEETVECFAHAMPFAELVRAVGEPVAPGRNPIFEVRFALQNHPVPDIDMLGMSLKLRVRSTGTPRFDLACEITEEGDGMEVAWLFRPNQFPSDDIQNLGRMYLATLAEAVRAPGA